MTNPPVSKPAAAVLNLEGLELMPLEPIHAAQVLQLLNYRGNRYLLDLQATEEEVAQLLSQLTQMTWALPLAIVRGDECVGMATTSLANVRSLNTSLLAMFTDPPSSTIALALYVRHVFWNFPIHRMHVQVPAMDLTAEYVDLYRSVGFREEGRLLSHALIGGQAFDIVTMSLLRREFADWCEDHRTELAL